MSIPSISYSQYVAAKKEISKLKEDIEMSEDGRIKDIEGVALTIPTLNQVSEMIGKDVKIINQYYNKTGFLGKITGKFFQILDALKGSPTDEGHRIQDLINKRKEELEVKVPEEPEEPEVLEEPEVPKPATAIPARTPHEKQFEQLIRDMFPDHEEFMKLASEGHLLGAKYFTALEKLKYLRDQNKDAGFFMNDSKPINQRFIATLFDPFVDNSEIEKWIAKDTLRGCKIVEPK